MAHLRANRALRRLVVRGVDITDAGMPYIGEMTGLRSLDISYTMLGDVGLEHLPNLSELEHLKIGATLITGLNLNFLKLLPKLKTLSLRGVQRRNAGACWTPNVTDLDLDTISLLAGLEELDLGVGIKLGMGGKPAAPGGGNCTLTGGLQLSDLGIAKLAKLKNLKRLNISGARLTPEGLQVLQSLPLERLSVWASQSLDDAAADVLAGMPTLAHLDMSYTNVGDQGLQRLAKLPNLKALYLTETQVSAGGGRRVPEAASRYVRVVGEAAGAARRAADQRETCDRGNAMTVRLAGLSLALMLFVSMMAAPRPQAQASAQIPCSSNRRCFPCSKRRSAAAATRRRASRPRRACTFPTRTRRRRRSRRSASRCRVSSIARMWRSRCC